MPSLPRLLSPAAAALASLAVAAAAPSVRELRWEHLPPLPPSPGQARQPGIAGPFAGVHRDALIVAGGANFPGKMPWDGGKKVWWDDLFVLERTPGGGLSWITDKTFKLPRPVGYGVSFSTPDGVVCVGGSDAASCFRDVFLLSWDPRTRAIVTSSLPPLPEPLTTMAGASIGQTIYVAGGQHAMKDAVPSSCFWALDLSRRDRPADFRWEVLPTWPGPPRVLPVAAAQPRFDGGRFLLFGGRIPQPGRPTVILTDAYAYDPAGRTWQTLRNIQGRLRGGGDGRSVMAGVAVPAGRDEVLLLGGDCGDLFRRLEELDLEIAARQRRETTAPANEQATLQREIAVRVREQRDIYERHPGC